MQTPSAYLLVSHGSRDPRPQIAMAKLADSIQQKMQALCSQPCAASEESTFGNTVTFSPPAPPLIGIATLECAPLPLHEQIQQFSSAAIARGIRNVQIVPLFLLPGVHVTKDLPEQVAIAQQLQAQITLKIAPHIGSNLNLKALLADCLAATPAEAYILLSHGSRRSQANHPVEALAAQLGAVPAYWSVAPDLESRLQEFSQLSVQNIAILPYFLFSGSITDAIARSVEQFSQQFPSLHLYLASPLEASDDLANLLVDAILQSQN